MLASNGAGISFAYFVGPLILLVFAAGYASMSMRIEKAGAFYSYVMAAFGRPAGVGAGFMALFGYLLFQAFVFALLGVTTNGMLAGFDSPFNLEWWGWTVISLALVAFLGYFNIDLSAKVLAVALILEVLAVLVIDFAILLQGGGVEGISFTSIFAPEVVTGGSLPLAIMFGLSVGLGFEATAIFRDEARDPRRTIPRAIYVSIGSALVFYVFATWALFQGFGGPAVMDTIASLDDPTALLFIASDTFIGPVFTHIVSVLAVTSMFACVLSYHNIAARYLHSLGHTVLPKPLSAVHPKHRSPFVASFTASIISALLFVAVLVAPTDIFTVMQWCIAIGTFAILLLLLLTAAAIFTFFRKHPELREGRWSGTLSPLLSGVAFLFIVVTALMNFGALSASGDPLVNIALQAVPFLLFVIGIVVALISRRRHPERYEHMHEQTSITSPVTTVDRASVDQPAINQEDAR
ncbi:APC family permease [Agrococcus citreus]|uniref:APC family permease n=2 Tax=Agrococcus citreus TaxID=84643 RepID=A0ABN1YZB8_9MICO